jgi:alcohol dehydrogenase class IV
LLPEVAIIDPELTYEVPKNITATTGMDAFTQVLEPYVSKNNNPLVDLFCREAIPLGAIYLKRSWEDGNDIKARGKMAWVSLLGGLALANAKLGAVHGFAGSIGGMFNVPHGSVCAALLASVFSVNVKALSKHDNSAELISRYSDIAKWITGHERASISDGVEWLANLSKELGIPSLSHLGIKRSDFQMIIEKSKNSSSMKGNPVQLTDEELENILDLSY